MNIEGTAVRQIKGTAVYFYTTHLRVDADGSPHAYNPADSGLDYLANAGRPKKNTWWALVTLHGDPIIQGDNDPAPGYYVSTTSLVDTSKEATDPHRYADAETIPFLAVPSALLKKTGAAMGDYAYVLNTATNTSSYAILADVGPAGKLGEGSIALARKLGLPTDLRNEPAGADSGICYVIFPGSGNRMPHDVATIEENGRDFVELNGGVEELAACVAGR